MPVALIISLNFNPGHVSHLVATYHQMLDLGYKAIYCITKEFVEFLPKNASICIYGKGHLPKADIAFFLFPSQKNLNLIRSLKRGGTRIFYVFHEPLAPMREYKKAGFSYAYLAKLWIINRISSLTVKRSDAVLLPSLKAINLYNANPIYENKNYHYLPLLFDDERTPAHETMKREYFSYIGTVAADHSFKEYLQFIEWAIKEDRLPGLKFLIATKSEFEVPPSVSGSTRVEIRKGSPLSNEDINECYTKAYLVWNAYSRTTQSGVLAKSFMFGTPAIVLRKNLSEFTEDGKEVVAIDDNTSFNEIEGAINHIMQDFSNYSENARRRFETSFYYRNYNDQVRDIINSIQP